MKSLLLGLLDVGRKIGVKLLCTQQKQQQQQKQKRRWRWRLPFFRPLADCCKSKVWHIVAG